MKGQIMGDNFGGTFSSNSWLFGSVTVIFSPFEKEGVWVAPTTPLLS